MEMPPKHHYPRTAIVKVHRDIRVDIRGGTYIGTQRLNDDGSPDKYTTTDEEVWVVSRPLDAVILSKSVPLPRSALTILEELPRWATERMKRVAFFRHQPSQQYTYWMQSYA